MTSSKLALALVVAVGCGSSKSENAGAPVSAPAKVAEVTPPALTAPVPVPAKAPAKCGDGKLTLQDHAGREQDRATVFCKDDGTAAIQYVLLFKGEVQTKKTIAISIDQWNEIWQLADAANWQSGTLQCAPSDAEYDTSQSVDVFRAGTTRVLYCEGSAFAGPWSALSSAVFEFHPARED